MGLLEKVKVGEKISVLLERIEDKNGEVLVSASKAQKIKGWNLFKSSPLLSEKLISGQGFLDWNINSLNQKGINLERFKIYFPK